MTNETNRPLTPEEVEECAAIINSWSADDMKLYLSKPEMAEAVNSILRAQKELREES